MPKTMRRLVRRLEPKRSFNLRRCMPSIAKSRPDLCPRIVRRSPPNQKKWFRRSDFEAGSDYRRRADSFVGDSTCTVVAVGIAREGCVWKVRLSVSCSSWGSGRVPKNRLAGTDTQVPGMNPTISRSLRRQLSLKLKTAVSCCEAPARWGRLICQIHLCGTTRVFV
jgi:hypothetical protein